MVSNSWRQITCGLMLTLTLAFTAVAQEQKLQLNPSQTSASDFAYLKDGVTYVEGKPFHKRAAWWGTNHWMTSIPQESRGTQLMLKDEEVATPRDFYARAGYNVAYFSFVDQNLEASLKLLQLAIDRAKKSNQKIVLHLNTGPTDAYRTQHQWRYVDENGAEQPVPGDRFHWDPQTHVAGVRARLQPITDFVRNEPTVIGYQIGGETWAVVSFDAESLKRFRAFLQKDFSLEKISERYGDRKDFYKNWDEVFPSKTSGFDTPKVDFTGRELAHPQVAKYDWARFNKGVHRDNWIALVNLYNELDGRGRPISYEYNHGPYSGSAYGLYNFDFAAVYPHVKNFSVGPGFFSTGLTTMLDSAFVREVGQGPWFSNELGVRPPFDNAAALLRRQSWFNALAGFDGFHLWTFFNVLGAHHEFIGGRSYDPILAENLPSVYFESQHINNMMSSLGAVLASSKAPPVRVASVMLEDSSMGGLVHSYKADLFSIQRALIQHNLSDQYGSITEYTIDHGDLSAYRALILPITPRITEARAKKLTDYVTQGGTLLLMGPTASIDDLFKQSTSYPAGPLAQIAGVQGSEITGAELKTAPITVRWGSQCVFIDVRTKLTIPTGSAAQVLVRDDAGQPVVTRNKAGKGTCIVLAGKPLVISDDDPTADLLAKLLSDAGTQPAQIIRAAAGRNETGSSGVYAGRRVGVMGSLLILVESADKSHDLRVQLDPQQYGLKPGVMYQVFECFSDEKATVSAANGWTFATRLEPVGVRVYLVTARTSLDDVIPAQSRLKLDRDDPDQKLVSRASTPSTDTPSADEPVYRLGDAHRERAEYLGRMTVTADAARAGAPKNLGGGFFALDLASYTNQSMRNMLKDVDYSRFNQFGADVGVAPANARLPVSEGRNEIGDVPQWVSGRFTQLGTGERLRLEGLPVGRRLKSLHFFHQAILWTHESVLGYYQVNYSDGSNLRVPVALSSTLSDQSRPWGLSPKTTVIWESQDHQNRLTRYDWTNPFPERIIRSVDVNCDPEGRFSVWAITAKAPSANEN